MATRKSLATMAYYSSAFPSAAVREWLKALRLSSRPFSGVTTDGSWILYTGFEDVFAAAKKGDIVEMHVSLGPDPEGLFGCFFLDFDINECLPRSCCGTEKKLCDVCLPVVVAWGLHLRDVVGHVLNVPANSVLCVLSGGKGMHLWARLPFPVHRLVRDSYYDRFGRRTWTDNMFYEVGVFVSKVPLSFLKHSIATYGTPEFQANLKHVVSHLALYQLVCEFRRKAFPTEDILDAIAFVYASAFPLVYDKKVVESETHNLRLPLSVNYGAGSRDAHRIVCAFKSTGDFLTLGDVPTVETVDEASLGLLHHAFDEI
jgi:hypothetical protein